MALFDLDGTITRRDTYSGILAHSLRFNPAGIPKLVPLMITAARFGLGRLDNTALKTAFLKSLFGGMPENRLNAITRSFVDRLFADGLRPPALETLSRHQASGHQTVLLSASLDFYVEEIAGRLSFDHCICTRTVRGVDNALTGELRTANCRGEEKLSRLTSHFGDARGKYYFVGYGDRETDFHLLTALDQGIVVSPDRRTRNKALNAGLHVVDWNCGDS